MYRQGEQGPELLPVNPGGPFFKNKDDGVWSLPKGLADDGKWGRSCSRWRKGNSTRKPASKNRYPQARSLSNGLLVFVMLSLPSVQQ